MRRSLRKPLLSILAVAVVSALFYKFRGAVALEGFRWAVLATSVRRASPSLLLLSVGGIFVAYAIRTLRWMRFSRYLGEPTFPNMYSATLMGFACVFLLGRAGEPVRPLLIARKDHLPVSSTFGVYVLERVMDASATAVLAGCALLVFPSNELPGGEAGPLLKAARPTGMALLAVLLFVVAFLVYFRLHGAGRLAPCVDQGRTRGGWRGRLAVFVGGFSEGLQSIRTWSDLVWAIVHTSAHWLLIVYIYLWVSHSFGGPFETIDFGGAMLLLAFTMVGSAAQLPGVGGGTQVSAFLVFTAIFGVEKEPAAAAAIVLWLITFAASSLAGVPLLIWEGWSMKELRDLARAEAAAEAAGTHAAPPGGTKKSAGMPQ